MAWQHETALIGSTVRIGYPPQVLAFQPDDYTRAASEFGIRNGEQLILNAKESSGQPEAPAGLSARQAPPAPTSTHVPKAKDNRNVDGHAVQLSSGDGYLVLRVVPDDNSCLFSAISLALLGSIDENYMMRGSELGWVC